MDPGIGTLAHGDVLIEGGRIVAVAGSLGEIDAETIDTTAMIVAPENGMDRKNRRSINGSSRRGSKTSRPTNDPRASVKATMICPDVQP